MKSLGFVPMKGTVVRYGDQQVYVVKVEGYRSLIENLGRGDRTWVENTELAVLVDDRADRLSEFIPWNAASETDREIARFRREVVLEILSVPYLERTRKRVDAIAKRHRKSGGRAYRWLRQFDGTLDSLLPRQKFRLGNHAPVESRLDALCEEQIREAIKEALEPKTPEARLQPKWQRLSVDNLYGAVCTKCLALNIPPPSRRTVTRRRVLLIEPSDLAKYMGGDAEAWRFVSTPKKFEEAGFPYAIIQIDHTLLNIVILDREGRPIGCPWITVAIDVYSRCVVAFRISLDPPSAGVVGLVIARTILPKKEWLEKVDPTLLKYKTPFYGFPGVIHTDNGKDLTAKGIMDVLERYGIESNRRPKGKPNYGGHIENYIGTLTKRIYALPGAAPERVKVPKDYRPDKYATHTLESLEAWLGHEIFGTQNHEFHEGIQDVPIDKFIHGLHHITGAPQVVSGAAAWELEVSLYPSFEATIQSDGVTQHSITWWSPICRTIVSRYGTGAGKSYKTRFHYNPSGMKKLWFINPLDKARRYESVMWHPERPDYSEWEVKATAKELSTSARQKKNNPVNQQARFEAMARKRVIDEEQASKSRAASRRTERRAQDKKRLTTVRPEEKAAAPKPPEPPVPVDLKDDVLPPRGLSRWKR